MNRQQRTRLYEFQTRAFNEGTVEQINEQWVFFDNETEEATPLEDFLHQEVEIFRYNRWRKGILFEEGKLCLMEEILWIKNQDKIRIRKPMIYALEQLLEQISDDAFYQFITNLNALKFSIYDCLYCYNHLNFIMDQKRKNGVNFMIFDNQEDICNVQHHFTYFEGKNDRFEFTISNGKRVIIEKYLK